MTGHVVYFLDMAKRKGSRKSCPLFANYKTYWIKYVLPSISTTPQSCACSLIFPYDVLQHFYFFSFITISKSRPNTSAICRISFSEKLSRFIFCERFCELVSISLARSVTLNSFSISVCFTIFANNVPPPLS